MQKLFLLLIVVVIFAFSAYPQNNSRLWEFSRALGNRPSWLGGGTERGMTYSKISGSDRIYILSRTGPSMTVLNAFDGSPVSNSWNFTGVDGGFYSINDIENTDDHVLIASNMTMDASLTAFKFYVWTSEGGAPLAFTMTLTSALKRLGDKITVVGSWYTGTVEIWAGVSDADATQQGEIYVYKTINQGTNWTVTTITTSGPLGYSSLTNMDVAPLGLHSNNSDFYVTGHGLGIRRYSYDGAYVTNSLFPTNFLSSKGSLKYFKEGTRSYLLSYNYRVDSNFGPNRIGHGCIYDVTSVSNPSSYGFSTNLGDASQNSAQSTVGDVTFFRNSNGTYNFYVLDPWNGIGAYVTTTAPLPVELSSFTASVSTGKVTLNWNTATEVNNYGFNIERSSDKKEWKNLEFIPGNGNSNSPHKYSFVDNNFKAGKNYYRLKQIDNDGVFKYYDAFETQVEAPLQFKLEQNYPNPFNPSTMLSYTVPKETHIDLKVYSVAGELVRTLVSEVQPAGYFTITFNASDLASGLYFYKLNVGGVVLTRKMQLIK